MPKVDIWMPIYIGDYLRDTVELTAEEHGAYVLLLMHYWQKNGEIGSDVDRLSRVARVDEKTCSFILGYYFTLVDGNYRNKRADEEMENAANRRNAASENGKKGGRPPINNPEKSDRLPAGNLTPNPRKSSSSSSSSSSSPSESPSPSEKEEEAIFEKPLENKFARIESARTIWNEVMPNKPYRYTALNMGEQVRSECLRPMSVYSDDEIGEAIRNYARILASPEHEVKSPFESFHGFMRTGVEKFDSGADPWSAYKKKAKGFETAGEREERERAEAIERLSHMGENDGR